MPDAVHMPHIYRNTHMPHMGIVKYLNINLLFTSKFIFELNRGGWWCGGVVGGRGGVGGVAGVGVGVADIFPNFVIGNTDVHGYSTRQHHHVHVPCERNNLRQFSLRYRGAIFCNLILILDIIPNTSEVIFG